MTIVDNIFIYQIIEEEQLEKPDQLVVILTGHGQSVASYSVSVCVSERERAVATGRREEQHILYDNIPVLSGHISVSIPTNEPGNPSYILCSQSDSEVIN